MEHLQVTSVGAVGFMQEWLGSEWDSPEKELAKTTEKELPKRSGQRLGLVGTQPRNHTAFLLPQVTKVPKEGGGDPSPFLMGDWRSHTTEERERWERTWGHLWKTQSVLTGLALASLLQKLFWLNYSSPSGPRILISHSVFLFPWEWEASPDA